MRHKRRDRRSRIGGAGFSPHKLAHPRMRGWGDHEVVEGGGERSEPMPPKAAYKLIAERAIPQPFEPSEPCEPFEPYHRQ